MRGRISVNKYARKTIPSLKRMRRRSSIHITTDAQGEQQNRGCTGGDLQRCRIEGRSKKQCRQTSYTPSDPEGRWTIGNLHQWHQYEATQSRSNQISSIQLA